MLLSDALKKPRKKAAKQQSKQATATTPAPAPPEPPVIDAAERARAAKDVMRALDDAIRKMGAWSADAARLEGSVVTGGYRSSLPKEGAYAVGHSRYEQMVNDEISRWREVLKPHLMPYKSSIKRVRTNDEEKWWIYTEIELK